MIKKNVFMVMPFDDIDAQEVYEHCTRKICEKFNLEIRRADELFTTNVILEDILEEIKNASVIIVDISGKNANVFYELGMAHVLKPQQTIMITNDPPHEAPFDVQHFRIIHYDNTTGGGESFKETLSRTLENLLKDYRLIYADEFEWVLKIMSYNKKHVELCTLVGISKLANPPKTNEGLLAEGHVSGSKPIYTTHSLSIYNSVAAFFPLKYLVVENGILLLTEKGKAFISYLEEQGYVCDYINETTLTPGYVLYHNRTKRK